MKSLKPLIAITMGDPCGIGPEVIVKALRNADLYRNCNPLVIGDFNQIESAASRFAPDLKLQAIKKVSECAFEFGLIEVLNISSVEPHTNFRLFQYGRLSPDAAKAAFESIELAARLALSQEIDGIATAPINKEGMKNIGFGFPGHTEFFAQAANEQHFGMMMVGGGLKIMLASIHLPLREAIAQLNSADLLKSIQLTESTLRCDFGIDQPHIAVAGLNPHAGERGILGEEELSVVAPAIERAKNKGLNVSGPYPADTLFFKLQKGQFDAAVALYHDQALIPIKLLAFGAAVNITVGLPFIRTSVDHGTAFDIAGKGKADSGSMEAAVLLAAEMAENRPPKFSSTHSG